LLQPPRIADERSLLAHGHVHDFEVVHAHSLVPPVVTLRGRGFRRSSTPDSNRAVERGTPRAVSWTRLTFDGRASFLAHASSSRERRREWGFAECPDRSGAAMAEAAVAMARRES
jgi:hypothetical protein